MLSDCVLLLLSAYLAFVIPSQLFIAISKNGERFLFSSPPVLAIPVFIRFGLYHAIIRYLAERAIWPIFQATAIAALSGSRSFS